MSRLGAASLVVLAVLVGTAAAAAPDRKPPRIVAGVMLDRDRDQRSDAVRLTYSEPVRHRVDRDRRYPFSLLGYRIRSVAAARGRTLLLLLAEKSRVDAGTKPLVRYRRTKATPVLDRAGNQAVAQRFRGVRPLTRVAVVVPPPAPAPPPPNPEAPPDLDPDRDGYVAPLDCKPNDPAIHPGAEDAPDLGFADTNCDGIDGDEAKAVFASPQGDDRNPGTKDKPKRQIQAALIAAAGVGRPYVLVAAGSYGAVVAADDGVVSVGVVGIYGGYDAARWSRSTQAVTSIVGVPEGILADRVKLSLQLLGVRGQGVSTGDSAYGIRAIRGSSLLLQRVMVTAGNGMPGAAGANGAAGRPGSPGQKGANGACDSSKTAVGGAGGESPVARDGGKGGDGKYESRGGNGQDGIAGTPGGKGGEATSGHTVVTVEGDQSGKTGQAGTNGVAGFAGRGGTSSTARASVVWQGMGGVDGVYGGPGEGGGGGGAGGGQVGAFVINGTGNGGAGGGGGGEGGRGGGAGGPGGGSFGVWLNGSGLVAEQSTISAGDGGAGGRGGHGGPGGAGGAGGPRNDYCLDEIGEGAAGGRGGNGGPGGGGGGGAGGPSVGIFKVGSALPLTLTETTVTVGTPGPAGTSGTGGAPAAKAQAGIRQGIYP